MILEWKWECVTMDFVLGLSLSPRKKDVIWIAIDRLTKYAHFIHVHTDFSLEKLAELYVFEIIRLHGVSLSIIFYRDPRFTSRYLRICFDVIVKFFFCQLKFFMTTVTSRVLKWPHTKLYMKDLICETEEKVKVIRDCLKVVSDRQKSYADLKRKDIKFQVGDKVFLKVSPWKKFPLGGEL
ncbi:integrase [Gossypium australe]|uniref:Integrase n=1 Tax=Gossypium australe TaxID=47621 RepID=A0A5B6VL77_9ROSI|nr:integrase [Gossypium australe]